MRAFLIGSEKITAVNERRVHIKQSLYFQKFCTLRFCKKQKNINRPRVHEKKAQQLNKGVFQNEKCEVSSKRLFTFL